MVIMTNIKLKPTNDDLPENPWLEGDDLHFIDESGQYRRIKNYTTEWYVSKLNFGLEQECNENITMVGNAKCWNSPTGNNVYDELDTLPEVHVNLSNILDGYPLVDRKNLNK